MSSLEKLEEQLDDLFEKKVSIKMSPGARRSLAQALWWISLVVGILSLWSAAALWQLGHAVDNAVNTLNSISTYYGAPAPTTVTHLGFFYYGALLAMIAVGVLLLLAAPNLKNMRKVGWNYLFYALLLQAAVAVVRLFASVGGGFVNFLGSAIGAAIGAFLLFQVRGYFIGYHYQRPDPEHHSSVKTHASKAVTEDDEKETPHKEDKKPKKDTEEE